MAGTVKVNNIQIGDSTTASQNFVLSIPASPDGTVKLARGNVGATTQDVLVVNQDGGVKGGIAPAFSAYASSPTSLTSATNVKLALQAEEYDTANAFDSTTNYRFQPSVAGYYQVSGGFQIATTVTVLGLYVYKNGILHKNLQLAPSNVSTIACYGSCLVYLNGTTDYVELWASQAAATQNNVTGATCTYFQGFLARAA